MSDKVAYILSNDGNTNKQAEVLYVNGKAIYIQTQEQVQVEPYVRDLFNEIKTNEFSLGQTNERMQNHDYI